MRTLTKDEYVWAVTAISPSDGHRVTAAWFRSVKDADAFAATEHYGGDQRVVQTTLWRDDDGKYYEVTTREIPVDEIVHRRSALSKLTPEERAALRLE